MAPAKATPRHVPRRARATRSPSAASWAPLPPASPASVAGLCYAQRKYGKLPLAAVMAPAIRLAESGSRSAWRSSDRSTSAQNAALALPRVAARLHEARQPLRRRRSPRAARSRAHAPAHRADAAPTASTRRPIAELIEAEMVRTGGLIRKSDLASYKADRARAGARHVPRTRRSSPCRRSARAASPSSKR